MSSPADSSEVVRRYWPLAVAGAAAVVVVAALIASVANAGIRSAGIIVWAVTPYVLAGALVRLAATRSRAAWWLASIATVIISVFGIYLGLSVTRSSDAQATIVWIIAPIYQVVIIGVAAGVTALLIVARRARDRA